jgi:uncharacterized protein (DUF1778 family)
MYTKDKNQRITLRLNPEQFDFVQTQAEVLGVSPSDFLRMMVNASMAVTKKIVREDDRRENEIANKHDIV